MGQKKFWVPKKFWIRKKVWALKEERSTEIVGHSPVTAGTYALESG